MAGTQATEPNLTASRRRETLTGAMDMDEIEEFAEQLLAVSDKYQVRGMRLYAEQLRDWAQQFDIVRVETMLREFPNYVNALSQQ